MAKQMMFYERAVPVPSARHRDLSVKTGHDYNYARNANFVPVTAVEFPSAATDYGIVFAGTEDAMVPVVVLGLENAQNRYVNSE